MEARLLCLEKSGEPADLDYSRRTWFIANGTGLPISQAHIPTAPTPLFTTDYTRRGLIQYLTAEIAKGVFAVVEHGWSGWFVENLVES